MKKREITNNELEQMFKAVIEQTPLLNEDQVNSFLINLPKSNPGSAFKRFFRNHLNTFLLSAGVVFIVAVTLIWINSSLQSEEAIVRDKPGTHHIATIPIDTSIGETAKIVDKEISQNQADEDTVLKETTTKTSAAVVRAEKTISLPDIYKHLDKKPQIFSIQANRDTTITCKEGTTIKINANSFISEKSGNEISGIVQIAVKEYYKISDIILSNLTTTSGDKILETGGMLHIDASANNENCIIKPGLDIEIGFPYSTKKEDMDLFYGEQIKNKIDWKLANKIDDVIIQDKLIIIDSEAEQDFQTFFIVEDMPEFPGGGKALEKYIEQNAQYPFSALENRNEGKVFVSFVIDKSGYTNNIRVARSLDKILDKVAVYAVSNMPKWKPGKQRGKPVNVSYTIAVPFKAKNVELTPEEI